MRTQNIYQQKEDIITSDSVKMSIDTDSIDYLMHNLTNLYSDPVSAVVREYVSNAYDSHIRAGVKNTPVQVSFDSVKNIFTVEDFGVGMSKQEIIDIYSKYGLSTKNNTNTEIGAFGLGAKSALAITDRFDITARKDGLETIAYVEKNSKGVGVVHFVSETPTTQPNGFKITVASPRLHSYLADALKPSSWQNVHEIFLPYNDGEVLFNGKTLPTVSNPVWETIEQDGEILGWIAYTVPSLNPDYDSQLDLTPEANLYYNVGKVLYTSNSSVALKWRNRYRAYSPRIIVNVPIGSVDLTPSRESLMDTERTEETLTAATKNFLTKLNSVLSGKLSTKEGDEFLEYLSALSSAFPRDIEELSTYNYRGEPIRTVFNSNETGILGRIVSKASPSADVKMLNFTDVNNYRMFHSDSKNSFIIIDNETTIISTDLVSLGKEAFYYANSFNKNAHKWKTEIVMFKEETVSQVLPETIKQMKKVYTVEEFFELVKERRSEVRKEAAANRSTNSSPVSNTGEIFLPASKVVANNPIVFYKKLFNGEEKPAGKTAYLNVNESTKLNSLMPVLGWRYNNNFGVELQRQTWHNANKNLPQILSEALDGWDLILIPPRRLMKNVEKYFNKLVPAEKIVEEYIAEQLQQANEDVVLASAVKMFTQQPTTMNLMHKTNVIASMLGENINNIDNSETRDLINNIVHIHQIIDKENPFFKIVAQAQAWRTLPAEILEKSEQWENQLQHLYNTYPMLETVANQQTLETMQHEKTLHHIHNYVNMVDKLNFES